ncbi:efflux RND transporter periplasmic adaptor subunit [Geobacillus subterraneus]|uniref:efflux RND transporter periplasmic adaptor subunit n=1 Tax=Geobacillus subterraneus TaxID=129338 RepID=UPI002AC9B0E8|nr:efflux RND transporter periplasmic adaptor subunit [Geobacillus subterraneus]WPZ18118.1 efflux RND transporter periplasmic adaptor subunit [Geobacillus subterraneus]
MKRALTAVLAIGLIGVQFYVAFADDSRVPKSVYANEWTKPTQQNVQETIKTTGFTAPAERTFIYYDPQRGAIDDILVKKGQTVQPGTPLLRYRTDAIDRELAQLTSKQQQLSMRLSQLSEEIQNYRSMAAAAPENSFEKQQWEEKATEAEREKTELQWQQQQYEQERTELLKQKEEQTVESTMDGIVEAIDPNPSNPSRPLITIASLATVIQGKITESLVGKLAIDQTATIRLPNEANELSGTVSDIGLFPINEPSFRQQSEYLFTVKLIEQAERAPKPQPSMPFGYHVDITIVTKEKNGAITVPTKAVWRENNQAFVYLIRNGQLDKRRVTLGVKQGNRQEIEQGLTGEEYVITRSSRDLKQGMNVWMPLEITKLSKETIQQVRKRDMAKYFLEGVFRAF